MEKKYYFTGDEMEFEEHTLQRIAFFFRIGVFDEDQPGGWIEGEHNLSHEGESCVLDEAKVFGNARIEGNALVNDDAIVKDNAVIKGDSYITDCAVIGADTIVDESSWIIDTSRVFFYHDTQQIEANVLGESRITGNSVIEATGRIKDTRIYCEKLSGNLNIEIGNFN